MLGRLVTRLVDAQAGWARPFGEFNHRWLSALFRPIRPVKDFLNGTWLGHPVHSALTDVPIGGLTVAIVLDIIGQPVGADVALLVSVLAMLAAAATGLADYTDTDGTARMRATVHSTLMIVALVLFAISLVIRAGNPPDRTVAIGLLVAGYLIVSVGAAVGGDLVYLIGTNGERGAAAEQAIKVGYRKLAHIGGPLHTSIGKMRLAGFKDAHKQYNMQVDPNYVIHGGFGEEDGYRAFMKWYGTGHLPECIFAVSYPVALGVYRAAKELGVVIPRDFDIIAYGSSPLNKFLSPQMTYIEQPTSTLGRVAVELTLENIKNIRDFQPKQIQLPTRLVLEDTCRGK